MNNLDAFYKRFGSWVLLTGSLSVFISYSFISSTTGLLFFIAGALLALSDPAIFLFRKFQNKDEYFETSLYIVWGMALLATALFFLRHMLDVPLDKVTVSKDTFISRLRLLFLALFALSYLGSMVWRIFLGLGISARESVTNTLREQKKQSLNKTILSILTVVPILVLLNYLTVLRNPILDFPGDHSFGDNATTIIKSLEQKVQVYVFLPAQQPVRTRGSIRNTELFRIAERIKVKLEQLSTINSRIKLEFRNADLETDRVADFGSVNNGTIIFRVNKQEVSSLDDKPYVERRVYIYAEKDLAKMEREVVRALVQVSAKKTNVYYTANNGERFTFTDQARKNDGLNTLQEQLRFFNFNLKKLDDKSGWPGALPKDINTLMIAGPTVPFGEEARKTITKYIKDGGNLFVAIDPTGQEDFSWLIRGNRGTKLRFDKTPLSYFFKNAPGALKTDNIGTHRITENLKLTGNKTIFFINSGSFEEVRPAPRKKGQPPIKKPKKEEKVTGPLDGLTPNFFLNSKYNTIKDANRNGVRDGSEKAGRYRLGIALTKAPAPKKPGQKKDVKTKEPKSPKVVLYSSVEWMTNRAMHANLQHVNITLATDSLFWMTESPLAGVIQPKKKKSRNINVTDAVKTRLFILGAIVFPLLAGFLTFAGVYFYRKRRRFHEE